MINDIIDITGKTYNNIDVNSPHICRFWQHYQTLQVMYIIFACKQKKWRFKLKGAAAYFGVEVNS